MGTCIICGSDTEGRICDLHEEDVVFEFRGNSADELTTDRYYRGTVDGYADFGVFVDIGDSVTGLLHRSELEQRLDGLDWEPGDTVFVQVKNVRDNGNVDLSWSIRQDETAFRGTLVHDPDTEGGPTLADTGNASEGAAESGVGPSAATPDSPQERPGAEASTPEAPSDGETAPSTDAGTPATSDAGAEAGVDAGGGGAQVAAGAGGGSVAGGAEGSAAGSTGGEVAGAAEEDGVTSGVAREPSDQTVDELPDKVGDLVRLEGEIVDAHQTSGPTVFTLLDETGTVECAAFESAGVRAYPEVAEDDVVRLDGVVERRRGDLQVETEALVVLEDDERDAVADRLEEAMLERARPEAVEPLAEDPAVEAAIEGIRDVATAIRRAVIESRPVVVRHSTTTDGYAAGVALERATLPLVREEHLSADAEYHYFDRRPLEGSIYDLEDATKDVTSMLSNRERHGEALPLFVFVGVGGSPASLDAFDLLDVYDAPRVLIDDRGVESDVAASVDTIASPDPAEGTAATTTATALAATTAAAVNPDVADDVAHLPAVSFWEDAPSAYVDLASEAGFDEETLRNLREAVALEAFYQSYEDKRELVIDLLFPDDEAEGLAARVAGQFREKIEAAVETAEANLEAAELEEIDPDEADLEDLDVARETVVVLDTEAYTHRYEFPPVALLLDELWRRNREDAVALLGLNTDEGRLRTDADVEVAALVNDAAMAAPRAGVGLVSPRDGEFEYLAGEREDARDAVLEALGDHL
ncbi:MAG: OB-fold nucleic acid binding domain-containing protein [Haloarculaceae archaeon]